MHAFLRSPAQPKRTYHEERASDTCEGQAAHFLVLRPRTLGALGAEQDRVPGQVHDCGDDCADADGEEGEACFSAVEVVDAGENDGVGLEVDVEYGV